MTAGIAQVPRPSNEPVFSYAPGDEARAELQAELERQSDEVVEVPCVVNGEQLFTGDTFEVTLPFDHQHVVGRVHMARPRDIDAAAEAAMEARQQWAAMPWEARAAVLLKAADLLTGPYRAEINAATMLSQGKTCHQAEIDAICELADFWRFNAWFARDIYAEQPPLNSAGVWNRTDHRPLDGFVFAITPFNFLSIALNLPTAPALMGNTVLWKPTLATSVPAFKVFSLLEEAGLPPGVINLLHGRGADVGDPVLARPELAGLHFTGSTATFQHLWRELAQRLDQYVSYPRIVGETGGKDFVVAHPTADVDALIPALLRGAYEYQGQKCSAASRVYVPASMWAEVRDRLVAGIDELAMGDPRDFTNFLSAVIDEKAFRGHEEYLRIARESSDATVLAGGEADDSKGWFVQPTLVQVTDPGHVLIREEIFGPILTAFVYDDANFEGVLEQVDTATPYGLTGAIFAQDRQAVLRATERLRFAAGNFYINDKPTGAVVGQQPFGGSRASGTNDKAGSPLNLLRWISQRTIKETFDPPKDWRYPFMG